MSVLSAGVLINGDARKSRRRKYHTCMIQQLSLYCIRGAKCGSSISLTRLISSCFDNLRQNLLLRKAKQTSPFVSNAGRRDFTTFDSLTHCCIKTPRKETVRCCCHRHPPPLCFSANKFYVSGLQGKSLKLLFFPSTEEGDRKTNVTSTRLYFFQWE